MSTVVLSSVSDATTVVSTTSAAEETVPSESISSSSPQKHARPATDAASTDPLPDRCLHRHHDDNDGFAVSALLDDWASTPSEHRAMSQSMHSLRSLHSFLPSAAHTEPLGSEDTSEADTADDGELVDPNDADSISFSPPDDLSTRDIDEFADDDDEGDVHNFILGMDMTVDMSLDDPCDSLDKDSRHGKVVSEDENNDSDDNNSSNNGKTTSDTDNSVAGSDASTARTVAADKFVASIQPETNQQQQVKSQSQSPSNVGATEASAVPALAKLPKQQQQERIEEAKIPSLAKQLPVLQTPQASTRRMDSSQHRQHPVRYPPHQMQQDCQQQYKSRQMQLLRRQYRHIQQCRQAQRLRKLQRHFPCSKVTYPDQVTPQGKQYLRRQYAAFIPNPLPLPRKRKAPLCLFVNYMGTRKSAMPPVASTSAVTKPTTLAASDTDPNMAKAVIQQSVVTTTTTTTTASSPVLVSANPTEPPSIGCGGSRATFNARCTFGTTSQPSKKMKVAGPTDYAGC